jgi:methyl-accepting chemotaxis protein
MSSAATTVQVHAPRPSASSDGFFAHHGIWAPGVRLFRRLRFTSKAVIISLAFVLPLLGLLGWELRTQIDQALQDRMDSTRAHVEIAHGVIAWAQAQEAGGRMTHEQAQQVAREAVGKLRYDRNEYFWIQDMQPRMVMHPIKPELDGQDIAGMKDPNGFALFIAMTDVVRKDGAGFVSYQWPKPGSDRPVDKISYVKGFQPWGWTVGSGIYVGDLRDAAQRQLVVNLMTVGGSLLMAGYLFLSFYRVMDGGLKETRRHLRAMTAGDLTTSPSPWGDDEAAQLMFELRNMQEALRTMVLGVRGSSDTIVSSSSEIARGAGDLSSRTEQAAANLEETAASMEQIAATARSTADHTAEAAKVAQHNAEVAAHGGRAMRAVIDTMDGIRGSSTRIAEITSTIDGIAFQTNILALNAAVEAARAGEQGRGFAVVAGEVRSLAQRAAEAAREIKSLIGTSVDQVEAGAGAVRDAGATMEDIVASTRRVSELLGEIATGAREQTAGIGQIGHAVAELDQMTQQNAAMVEQTAAAAGEMQEQAHGLAEQVSRFQLPADSAARR